jgi:hypothetical protein
MYAIAVTPGGVPGRCRRCQIPDSKLWNRVGEPLWWWGGTDERSTRRASSCRCCGRRPWSRGVRTNLGARAKRAAQLSHLPRPGPHYGRSTFRYLDRPATRPCHCLSWARKRGRCGMGASRASPRGHEGAPGDPHTDRFRARVSARRRHSPAGGSAPQASRCDVGLVTPSAT